MKLTQIITIGIISLAISLSSCMQNKENKTTESSDKTEHKIAVKKTFLKGLTMADKEDFSKERVMLSDGNITVYDIEGNKIKGMKLMQAMKSGNYIPEYYVDKNNDIKVAVLRTATEAEKKKMNITQDMSNEYKNKEKELRDMAKEEENKIKETKDMLNQ
jgi:hypothetical protein